MATKRPTDPLESLFSPPPGSLPALPDTDDEDPVTPAPLADAPEPAHLKPVKAVARPVSLPPPAAPPAGPDPRELAKMIAKAAAAKAGAPPKPAAKPAPAPAPAPRAAAAAPAAPAGPRSLLAAPPPKRALSAAEAMEAARAAESAKPAEPAPRPAAAKPAAAAAPPTAPATAPPTAPSPSASAAPAASAPVRNAVDAVQALLKVTLPNAAIYVPAAVVTDDRVALMAVWKAHRARMIADGDIERAAIVAAVVRAFSARPLGAIAAAHLVLDGGEYIGWMDLDAGAPIGLLPNPHVWGVQFR